MTDTIFYIASAVLSLGVLYGIKLMSKVQTAAKGNQLSALSMLLAVVVTFIRNGNNLGNSLVFIILGLLAGSFISVIVSVRVKMIQMPQLVGLLNGLGGFASAVAAILTVAFQKELGTFELITAGLALGVGALTFSGSLVAAGKLHGKLPQRPVVLPMHKALTGFAALVLLVIIALLPFVDRSKHYVILLVLSVVGLQFGWLFAIRVGGADMPITISLLNSTSGVAAAIAGMALGDILLVAVGGIVGSSGLLLTQIMCRSMNRRLSAVLFGGSAKPSPQPAEAVQATAPVPPAAQEGAPAAAPGDEPADAEAEAPAVPEAPAAPVATTVDSLPGWLAEAQSVIIIPGYGMALSQAQEKVKQFTDRLQGMGKKVRFAIHPVAGRMPGHMNVLLAEVDIPYDLLCEMDEINADFPSTDLAIIIGANDVINPAANTAEGTPIYGMPILDADKAKHLVICNFDTKPGYAGVDNPLYLPDPKVLLLLGDAKDSLDILLEKL